MVEAGARITGMGVAFRSAARPTAAVGHESPLTTLRHYTAPTRAEVAEAASRVSDWIASRG
jgi:hypothetical protein